MAKRDAGKKRRVPKRAGPEGLPMAALIGGPLQAAGKASLMMAGTTARYLQSVAKQRVDFVYERIRTDEDSGAQYSEEVHVSLPLLAVVPIPNLQIEKLQMEFDLEVKSTETSRTEEEAADQPGADPAALDSEVEIRARPSTFRANARSTDTASKYHIELLAVNQGTPEALARIIDMMAAAVGPGEVKRIEAPAATSSARRQPKGTSRTPAAKKRAR